MDALKCIETRMSIRRFKPDPVPGETLRAVIGAALRAPSYKNSQPWEVAVVSGKKKEEITEALLALLKAETMPVPDIPEPEAWPPEVDARMADHMKRKGEAMGISLNDPGLLVKAKAVNFKFYRAPHGLFLYQDAALPLWSLFDIGIFAQTLMLSAHAHGLGTVPQAFLVDYAGEIKKLLGLPDTKRLVLGMSIGYPDPQEVESGYRSLRMGVDEAVKWFGD